MLRRTKKVIPSGIMPSPYKSDEPNGGRYTTFKSSKTARHLVPEQRRKNDKGRDLCSRQLTASVSTYSIAFLTASTEDDAGFLQRILPGWQQKSYCVILILCSTVFTAVNPSPNSYTQAMDAKNEAAMSVTRM
ncbi:hypothetical protein NHQ30_011158 [Ciborinia camelliae]|nr:hypothetical protein NHQ30_011158 [Ciborinia camelliae]